MALDLAGMFGNIPKKQLGLLGGIVGAAIIAMFVALVVWPMQEEINRLSQEARKLAAEVDQKRRIAQQLPQLEREVQAMAARLKEVLVKLPEEKDIPTLLTQISAMGQQAGLEFTAFRPGSIQAKEFYAEVPITLRVEGSYHTLGTFFDRLSRMPRIVTVGDFRISPSAAKKATDRTVQADFSVVTYTYGGAPAKGPAKPGPGPAKK